MNVFMNISGVTAALRNLNNLSEKIVKGKDMAINICCLKIEADAKKNITEMKAVDTGRLRSSITHEVKPGEGRVGTNVEYAQFVEYGTSKMKPRPYLYNAFQKNIAFIKKTLGDAVKFAMYSVGKRTL